MAVNAENIPAESLPPSPKRAGRLLPIILAAALLAALACCGYLFASLRSLKAQLPQPAAAKLDNAPKVKPVDLYAQLDPAFVVNFQDGDNSRYLQVGVSLMSHDAATIQTIKDADPVIRNALVMLFSGQSYDELSTTAGKQKLQAAALAAVRKIVADKQGKAGVEALYFTSFVMQ